MKPTPSNGESDRWTDHHQLGFAASNTWVQATCDKWARRPCPFCGRVAGVWWLSVLTTYSFSCRECGEVVEGYELYQDQYGHYHTENHMFPRPVEGAS